MTPERQNVNEGSGVAKIPTWTSLDTKGSAAHRYAALAPVDTIFDSRCTKT